MVVTLSKTESRGRPLSFDRDSFIDAVMNMFWARGYSNISINEIATATGLTRASIYNSFNTKEDLFFEVLSHYANSAPDAKLDQIQPGESVGQILLQMFEQACRDRAADTQHRGCLAINCINEMISSQTEVGGKLLELLNQRKKSLKTIIQQAVNQGELPPSTNAAESATFLLTFLCGFSTMSKSGLKYKELKSLCLSMMSHMGFNVAD